MNFFHRSTEKYKQPKNRICQEQATVWDVVLLSFKLLFSRIQFWIQPNILDFIFSLALVTAPAANAAMYHTVAAGLQDPGGSEIRVFQEMKDGFKRYFWKALLLSIINWIVVVVIIISIYFWVSKDTWILRAISIISFYGLVLWWLSNGYVHPILVELPNQPVVYILKRALLLGFLKPFQSMLFAVISSLLLVFGIIFLGPVMLIIPVLRAILMTQGYWFLTGKDIPGFTDISEYVQKKYINKRGKNEF